MNIKAYVEMINLAKDNDTKSVLLKQAELLIKQEKLKLKLEVKNNIVTVIDLSESTDAWLERFITANATMQKLKSDVRLLAPLDDPVLVVGPTGTGKEIIARALHGEREGKFVAINCAGLPEQLVESLMFGHIQGSFTGASKTTNGLMASAKNGTFFLDEVGELPMSMQGKFLRALQEKKIRKLGSEDSEDINCRIVCATNKNLKEMVKEKQFRLDLLARITTFELFTTSLDQRPEDIEEILNYLDSSFVKAWNETDPKCPIDRINIEYNVRSLQQHIKRYQVFKRLPK